MNIKEILRILLKELEITNVTLEDMEFSYMDRWYWITYPENGKENPTTVGFPEFERIELDFTGGRDTLVVCNENGFQRFTRRILDDIHCFEMEALFENIEKLVKRGIRFSLVEDGEERFRLGSDYEVQEIALEDTGLKLKIHGAMIWTRISENSKIRIYL